MTREHTPAPSSEDARLRRDKFRGALIGVAVGDGLGAHFEGHHGPVPRQEIAKIERDSATLRHTDDTAMTIALAESLLHVGGLDQDHLAAVFARHWEREPTRGYGAGTAYLLARVAAGEHWKHVSETQFGGQGSYGNGAAMRVAPAALHAGGNPARSAELARGSAQVTHTHPLGIDAAAVQAAAVATALTQPAAKPVDPIGFLSAIWASAKEPVLVEQLERVGTFIDRGTAEEIATDIGTGIEAHQAVPAAICAFLRHHDLFGETIRFAISLGGDTDTIAAMAGAIAGACLGERAIPTSWVERTEAATLLRELADRLAQQAIPPNRSTP